MPRFFSQHAYVILTLSTWLPSAHKTVWSPLDPGAWARGMQGVGSWCVGPSCTAITQAPGARFQLAHHDATRTCTSTTAELDGGSPLSLSLESEARRSGMLAWNIYCYVNVARLYCMHTPRKCRRCAVNTGTGLSVSLRPLGLAPNITWSASNLITSLEANSRNTIVAAEFHVEGVAFHPAFHAAQANLLITIGRQSQSTSKGILVLLPRTYRAVVHRHQRLSSEAARYC